MEKHFKLTNETKVNIFGVTLFRIECTIDCKWAKVGDKGGWVEKEDNIKGNAWVSGNAWVYGDAEVSGNAEVYGNAEVSGNADYCCFQSFGSRYGTTTVFREKYNGLCVRCVCFNGSLSDFEKAKPFSDVLMSLYPDTKRDLKGMNKILKECGSEVLLKEEDYDI